MITTTLSTDALKQRVFIRRASEATLSMDGKMADDWQIEPTLRCDSVKVVVGAAEDVATFSYLHQDENHEAFEFALKDFHIDDQVRVVVMPANDELADQGGEEQDQGVVLFEGILSRQQVGLQADEKTDEELPNFTAQAITKLDHEGAEHLIIGRWLPVVEDEDGASISQIKINSTGVFVMENPALPAAFNVQGRPNKSHRYLMESAEYKFQFPCFTHDDDPQGEWWDVGNAIGSLITMWLVGLKGKPLNRQLALHPDLVTSLKQHMADSGVEEEEEENETPPAEEEGEEGEAAEPAVEKPAGFDRKLVSLNVHGMNVLDAIERVAHAGNMHVVIEPERDLVVSEVDRRYTLNLVTKNQGRDRTLRVAKRGSDASSAEQSLAENNVQIFQLLRDGAEVVNHVHVVGQAYLDVRMELKPLWWPGAESSIVDETILEAGDDDLFENNSFFSRHVRGGAEFDEYAHVCRMWGLDCVGNFQGYDVENAAYYHSVDGFDWEVELDLNGAGNRLVVDREAFGVTEPIRWSRRVRRVLPLRNPRSRAQGIQTILEVSEDAGVTWERVDKIRYSSVEDYFGIMLDIDHPGRINLEMLKTGTAPDDPETTWWGLMKSGDLRFRLTCGIEADHAPIYTAKRNEHSPTVYEFGQYEVAQIEEVQVHPESGLSEGGEFWDFYGLIRSYDEDDKFTHALKDIAELRRDVLATLRQSVSTTLILPDIHSYKLGDRLTKIEGREFDLGLAVGELKRYPTIVGIEYTLAPGAAQSVRFNLSDEVLSS